MDTIENMDILPEWDGRAILLVDLDAFFASVEQLDHPEWKGLPVIVGGDADKRGVVSTCSYEARKYGVRSAMPSFQAKKLCPDAIWCHGNFARYREVSNQVMQIIRDETPRVQQVSIDEAFADITPTRINTEHPVIIAARIQRRVSELGVTCSIGLSTSKAVAKLASDMDKPNGLTVVYPGSEADFLGPMPVRALSGIGASAEAKLKSFGISDLASLASASDAHLQKVFGIRAGEMRARASGTDTSSVVTERDVKSVSHERSFAEDLDSKEDAYVICKALLSQVGRRLRRKGLKGSTLSVKIRFDDRSVRSAQTTLEEPTDDDISMMPKMNELIDRLWSPIHKVRLLGVGVSGFDNDPTPDQSSLFDLTDSSNDQYSFSLQLEDMASANEPSGADSEKEGKRKTPNLASQNSLSSAQTRGRLLNAFDALKEKYGESAVIYGGELRERKNTTGSSSKNPADYG